MAKNNPFPYWTEKPATKYSWDDPGTLFAAHLEPPCISRRGPAKNKLPNNPTEISQRSFAKSELQQLREGKMRLIDTKKHTLNHVRRGLPLSPTKNALNNEAFTTRCLETKQMTLRLYGYQQKLPRQPQPETHRDRRCSSC